MRTNMSDSEEIRGEKTTKTTKFGQFFSVIVRIFFIIFNFRLNGCLSSHQVNSKFNLNRTKKKIKQNWIEVSTISNVVAHYIFNGHIVWPFYNTYISHAITSIDVQTISVKRFFELLEKFPFGLIGKYLPWQRKQSTFNSHFERSSSTANASWNDIALMSRIQCKHLIDNIRNIMQFCLHSNRFPPVFK